MSDGGAQRKSVRESFLEELNPCRNVGGMKASKTELMMTLKTCLVFPPLCSERRAEAGLERKQGDLRAQGRVLAKVGSQGAAAEGETDFLKGSPESCQTPFCLLA